MLLSVCAALYKSINWNKSEVVSLKTEYKPDVEPSSSLARENDRRGGITTNTESSFARKDVVREILSSPRVNDALIALAASEGATQGAVVKRAKTSLESLVAEQNPWFSRIFDKVLGPMHTSAFTLNVDHAALRELEQLSRDNTLVFLPTHRSYADPFVVTKVLSDTALPRNYILGGDNIGFWPMGPIVRRSGAVLIRRSFGDDSVYKLMIKEYLAYLARNGMNIEWYMEGGRSRTGKLRPPMYGLLRYLGQALSLERSKSVVLVPVSITYDQLHEIWAMAEEEAGLKAKQKEGISWLASYARMQRKWIGTAYVRFGEPLSLTDALAQSPDNSWKIEKLAIEVFQRINKVTPVTGPALATLALLAVRNRALTLPEITGLVHPLLQYARQRNLPTEVVDELDNHSGIEGALASLVKANVVTDYCAGREAVYHVRSGSHNIAAFYRNSAIHWFVNRAILEVILLQTSLEHGGSDVFDVGWEQAHTLRDVLKFEFFFSEKAEFKEEMRAEAYILAEDFFDRVGHPEQCRDMLYQAPFLIAYRVLMPFIEAYSLFAECLAGRGDDAVEDIPALLKECTAVGKQYVLQHRIRSPESISQELFKNATKLAKNRNLLEGREGVGAERWALKNYLCDMVNAITRVEDLDIERMQITDSASRSEK